MHVINDFLVVTGDQITHSKCDPSLFKFFFYTFD